MHQILSLSNDAYEEIFQEIDTKGLVEKRGIIYVWTNKNLKSRNLEIKVRKELGIEQKLLTQKQVLELEPNLKPVFDAGVIYERAMHARDPHGILKKIFKLYLERGGKFIQTNIKSIEQLTIDETVIKSENEEYKFEKTVIASGAFSKKLTDQLGENIPLDTERGYHVHFKESRQTYFQTSYIFGSRLWYDTNESRFKSSWNGRVRGFRKSSIKKKD